MNKNYKKSIPHLKICSLISYNFNTNKTQAIYEVLDNQLFGAPISRFFMIILKQKWVKFRKLLEEILNIFMFK